MVVATDSSELAVGDLVVEIGLVLERIGLQVAGVERRVGHDVVGKFDDLDVETLLGGDCLGGFQHLRVRPGGDPDLDGFGVSETGQRQSGDGGEGERA